MAKFLLRLDDKLYERITAKANESKRSLNKHLEFIIERDLELVCIPKAGYVRDGAITIEEELARR